MGIALKNDGPWDAAALAEIRNVMFPPAQPAIADWSRFPWHSHASSPRSSQVLAIDVFGTIKTRSEVTREAVAKAIAQAVGVPSEGPWTIELEWQDERNSLAELTPTQVDAVAIGTAAIILFECKFTEAGGGCSQIKRDKRGLVACNGSYREQVNPQNNITARCALSGKGIKYWEFIPKIYNLRNDVDYETCPFAFDAYQWMRNLALSHSLAELTGKTVRVVAAFADASHLQTAKKVRVSRLGLEPALGTNDIVPLSYQTLSEIANMAAPDAIWPKLASWVEQKISNAAERR